MPRLFASDDDQDLMRAERDVSAAFAGLDLDLRSLSVVSNIFRAATAVRNHMENGVLAGQDLSWSAFTTLFVLRVWGETDARSLAAEAGVSAATLAGVPTTCGHSSLVAKRRAASPRLRPWAFVPCRITSSEPRAPASSSMSSMGRSAGNFERSTPMCADTRARARKPSQARGG